ncbi:MAG: hypothetical protein WBI09_11180 [Methanothrix sp.]|nr:hypothetical protein [Euryarchaeota archaeon]
MKIVLILGLTMLMLGILGASAQPEEVWNKTFGGSGIDLGSQAQETEDGGYILVGSTESYGAGREDAWLIKTDSNGNELWNRIYGGPKEDNGYSVQKTEDGGYITVGATKSYGSGDSDAWLIKTDAAGNKQWDKTFGGRDIDEGRSVLQANDGGYIIAGLTRSFGAGDSDAWLIKTDPSGKEQWNRTFGGPGYDAGWAVDKTNDGGYIITGSTESYGPDGSSNSWLIKTNSTGITQWEKTFGGSAWDGCRAVRETKDGGYILVGDTQSFSAGAQDVWVIKTDPSGKEQWNKTYGGSGYDWGFSIQQTNDSGYIIAGSTESYGLLVTTSGPEKRIPGNAWLIKTDSNGNELWNTTFGGKGTDGAYSIQETKAGGYIIGGSTTSYGNKSVDAWLIRVN